MKDLGGRDRADAGALVVAAAIFYLAPWAPVYALAFVVLIVLTWQRLDLALALVVLFAPFFMLPKHLGSKEFAPSEILIVLDVIIAVVWSVLPDTSRRRTLHWHRVRDSPFLAPAALFLIAGAVSTAAAADHHQALQAYRERILEPAAYFVLLLLLAIDLRRWRACYGALIAAGVVVGVVAVVQRVTNQDLTLDAGSSFEKVRSVYGSPDNLGLFLDRIFPVFFAALLLARPRSRDGWLWVSTGILLAVTLFLTFSRGAWAAIAIACLIQVAVVRHWGRWVVVGAIALVTAAGVLGGPRVVHALSSGHSGTVERRLYIWGAAARMIRDHPIAGIGPDNFVYYYAPSNDKYLRGCSPGLNYLDARAGQEPCLSHPHNLFLDVWLSTGILGLAAFLWLEALFWRALLRTYREAAESRVLVLGAAGAMAAGLLHGLVDNSYFLMDLAIVFWLLCGLASFVSTAARSGVPEGALAVPPVRE